MSRGIAGLGAIASLFIASVVRICNPSVLTCRIDYEIRKAAEELFTSPDEMV
jgi:hypothetical protein